MARMKQRRRTAAEWTSTNEVLLAGEIGVEIDTHRVKTGDGSTAWTSLAYTADPVGSAAAAQAAAIAAAAADATTKANAKVTDAIADGATTIAPSQNAVFDALALKLAATALDTDGTLAANSDTRIATQKAVKTYADQLVASADAMVFKGVIDCSSNPNYPAADRGHTYRVSVAGKIGGASGTTVEAGDLLMCLTDGTAAGTQAAVGAQWSIAQTNVDGAVVGPAVAVDGGLALFNGTTGKIVKADGLTVANDDILQRKAGAWTNRTPAQLATDLLPTLGSAYAALANPAMTRPNNVKTADYVLVAADAGKSVDINSASAVAVTIPQNVLASDSILQVVRRGAGAVSLVAASGVTIEGSTVVPAQYGALLLRQRTVNTWMVQAIGVLTDTEIATANKDGLVAVPSLRTLGPGAQQAAAGDHTHPSLYVPLTWSPADVYKPADTARTATTQLADPHLVSAIGAGEVWRYEWLLYVTAGGNAPDIAYSVTGPASSTGWYATMGITQAVTTNSNDAKFGGAALGSGTLGLGVVSAISMVHRVFAYVDNTAGAAGTVTLLWGQDTADAASVTMKIGSSLMRRRLA